jgi:hypothetical protein
LYYRFLYGGGQTNAAARIKLKRDAQRRQAVIGRGAGENAESIEGSALKVECGAAKIETASGIRWIVGSETKHTLALERGQCEHASPRVFMGRR